MYIISNLPLWQNNLTFNLWHNSCTMIHVMNYTYSNLITIM